ncbi:MAG: hypothetical protein IJ454_02110 [Clostridia bacterium]|nr:hypothetical protein [Clostridia bacterium]
MDISFSEQAFVFVAMVMCGMLCGIIFDVFRAVRHSRKTTSGIVAMQDLLFWLIELAAIYTVAFKLNYAHVRAFEGIALVMGSWMYFMTLSKYSLRFLCRVTDLIVKIVRLVLKPLGKALSAVSGIVNRGIRFVRGKLLSLKDAIKHRTGALRNRICPVKITHKLKSAFRFKKKLKKT